MILLDAVSHLSNAEGIMGFNRYSYAVNNPYKYTDPDGKAICGGACVIGAGVLTYKAYKAYKAFRAAAVVGTAVVATDAVLNESANGDAVDGVKEGKSPAQGEAGAKGQLEGSGEQDGALDDLGSIPLEEGSEWSSPDGSRQSGTVGDGSGRKVNVHPSGGGDSYPQGTPTLEVQKPNGKTEVKIRYPEDKSS
jgi:hypothetical protein